MATARKTKAKKKPARKSKAGTKRKPQSVSKRARAQLPEDVAARWVHISTLTAWADNPRQNDAAVEPVAKSLKRFGWGAPILAREANGEVVAGHTRLRAVALLADRVGTATDLDDWHPEALRSAREGLVPVRFGAWSERDAHMLALADNHLNELADWDVPVLTDLMGDYTPLEVASAGWTPEDLEAMAAGIGGGDPGNDGAPALGDLEYRVVVDCKDEEQQIELLDRFEAEGFKCRPLIS